MMPDDADAAVIWLHGNDETGKSWTKLEEALGLRLPWAAWAFPDAPSKEGWFPRLELPVMDAQVPPGTDDAVAAVHSMLSRAEANGIMPSRIVLGGFGPGAALALLAGRTYRKRLAGIAVISGWYMRPQELSSEASSGMPVLLCHGEEDDDVLFELYEEATRRLKRERFEVTAHSYPNLAHRDCATELTVLAAPKNFITACLPTLTPAASLTHASRGAAASKTAEPRAGGGPACGRTPEPCTLDEAELDRIAHSAAEMLVGASEQAEREANVAGRLVQLDELPPADEGGGGGGGSGGVGSLQALISLNGVTSMAEVALSVGSTQLELEVDGVAPLYVPLPKPVDVDAATVAKYNKKTGLLKVTLRLAS
jgi:predicted esterase